MRWMTAVATVAAVWICGGPATAMSDYKWMKRPLVIFAEREDSVLLARQRRIVAENRAALAERDVVVVWVVGNSISAELGSAPATGAATLRSRYGVADGAFRAILVGKDGGAKLSSGEPISANTLAGTIDAMPMRREEMRKK